MASPHEGRRRPAVGLGVGHGARHHPHHRAGPAPQPDDHQRPGDRDGQRRHPQGQHQDEDDGTERPDPRVGHDLEPPRPAHRREQAVGGVGQAVEVQAARDRGVHGHRHHRGERGRPDAVGQPPRRADHRADGDAHEGEPRQRALVRLGGPPEHGEEGERPPHRSDPVAGSASGRPATTR